MRAVWLLVFGLAAMVAFALGCDAGPSGGGDGGNGVDNGGDEGGDGDQGGGADGGNGGADGGNEGAVGFVFIHHSVGQDWLDNGLRDALAAKDYISQVNDITYGTDVDSDQDRPDSLGEVPGDLTDVPHWVYWFNDYIDNVKDFSNADAAGLRQAGSNRIVMFKSCFPNSDIWSDGEEPGDPFSGDFNLADFRAVYRNPGGDGLVYTHDAYDYRALGDVFAGEPETLFIVCTPPPNETCGDPSNGARGRQFADWLAGEWIDGYNDAHSDLHNVAVFDVFDVLANADDGSVAANLLRDRYVGTPGDSHPNAAGDAALTAAYATDSGNILDQAWEAFSGG